MSTMTAESTCRHCGRTIVNEDGRWIDPEATGDDSVWRETCDAHDTFAAEHEPSVNIWTLLEQAAPAGLDAIQDLYSWSLNYDAGKGPFTLFLDLIGYSMDEYGETFYDLREPSLGYVELSKLAAALDQYTTRPDAAREYVADLMTAETRG